MRFVVCGENLIDLIPAEVVSTAESRWSALAGGGPLNTSVALAKLGADTHYLGRIGADAFGRQIEEHLLANGVQLDLAVRSEDPTALGIVSLDEFGKASYNFHLRGTAGFSWRPGEFPELTDDDWLHFGSIGSVVGSGVRPLLDFVGSTEAAVSFDLNVRPTVIPDRSEYYELVSPLMAAVGRSGGIVKASDEDINWLVDDDNALAYAEAWAVEYDLSMFVVTLGEHGAVAVKPDGRHVSVKGRRVELVDTVGAGDTFMAGFLTQYAQNPEDLELALEQGIAASALVCTRKGANPPTLEEVLAFLA
ncbi:carbohydrate kinase [Tessaracoccus sp. OS52]|uniref:carbohydrate kinase family protein n=1 Tax=Tessaracoccus sp. OS52 TaxID=2886691 RepID=UPI001D113AF9|nr:carbohydrate kinase [Tessaracoccus sp. OS52]MCC2592658.1 carbohydrate kinase [Tessaracoccus sp. OS52]